MGTKRNNNSEYKTVYYGHYAETDLDQDQPTNFSLRYAEDNAEEEEEPPNRRFFNGTEQEDTIKTYYTEGTPYETPFNFSTATSMSDLRVDDSKDSESENSRKTKDFTEKSNNKEDNNSTPKRTTTNLKTRKLVNSLNLERTLNPKELSELENSAPRNNDFSSETASKSSPIRDVNAQQRSSQYNLENEVKVESRESSRISDVNSPSSNEKCNTPRTADKEAKNVTFARVNHYEEHTPLMYSRSSSLGSLSGFDQHSIHDDRSSIVSDFSRRTSGIISPSELPDSPTQTVPPSPRRSKIPIDSLDRAIEINRPSNLQPRSAPFTPDYGKVQILKRSVFEDNLATFKDEAGLSAATSLSSLTIDDEPGNYLEDKLNIRGEAAGLASAIKPKAKISVSRCIKEDSFKEEKPVEHISDEELDDEDILAAVINNGMGSNGYNREPYVPFEQKKPIISQNPKPFMEKPYPTSNLVRYQTSSALNRLDPNYPTINPNRQLNPAMKTKNTVEVTVLPDYVHIYCTEDTPAEISPCGSQSNLSLLLPNTSDDGKLELDDIIEDMQDKVENDLSDASSVSSAEDEMLSKCIQSGMPSLPPLPPTRTEASMSSSNIDIPKDRNTLLQDHNKCGTPLSSPTNSSHARSHVARAKSQERQNAENKMLHMERTKHNEAMLIEIQSNMQETFKQDFLKKRMPSNEMKRNETVEENYDSLSEEDDDMILAQVIMSGMAEPMANSAVPTTTPEKPDNDTGSNERDSRMIQLAQRRLVADMSNLSLSPRREVALQDSRETNELEEERISRSFATPEKLEGDEVPCMVINHNCTVPSRHSSVASLSDCESLGSNEEWALLDMCISSGMKPTNFDNSENDIENNQVLNVSSQDNDDNFSVCSYNSYICKT